jgi:hypothetical protein
MMSTIAGLKLLLLLVAQGWESNGPHGGFIQGLTVEEAGFPAAYTFQGLFKYAGGNWGKVGEGVDIPFLGEWINELDYNNGRYWVCTSGSGLWWHAEGGTRWERADGIPLQSNVAGIASEGDTIVVVTGARLWVSEDGGQTFADPGWNTPGALFSDVAAIDGNVAAAAYNQGRIYIRNAADEEFYIDLPADAHGYITCLEWARVDNDLYHLYIGLSEGVICAINPQDNVAGPTWRTHELDYIYVSDLYAAPEVGIYAATVGDGVWYSTYQDDAWDNVSGGIYSLFTLGVDGIDEKIWAGTTDGLYQKIAGPEWSKAPGMPAQSFTDIEVNPDAPMNVFCTPLGSGVMITDNGGIDWYGSGIDEVPIAHILAAGRENMESVLYVGDLQGVIAVSQDAGDSWKMPDSLPPNIGTPALVTCNTDNPGNSWWVFQLEGGSVDNFTLWFGNDYLNSMDQVSDFGSDKVADLEYSPSDSTLYILTVSQNTLRAQYPESGNPPVNAGDEGLPGGARLVQIEASGNGIYALTGNNEVFFSSDGAENWSRVSGVGGVQRIAADPYTPDFLMVILPAGAGQGLEASVTPNYGGSWTRLNGFVPAAPNELYVCEVGVAGELAHAYVATRVGVFRQSFEIPEPGTDTLDLTITAESGVFRPETSEQARFLLGGETGELESWSVEIYAPEGYYVYGESGDGSPPGEILWDGYTWDGIMEGEGTYTAAFFGESAAGSGESETAVDLIIGNSPMSEASDATRGNRLLIQYNQAATDYASVIYRSREPCEFFGTDYNAQTGEFDNGYPVSATRDAWSRFASVTQANDGTHWIIWLDEDDSLEFPFNLYAMNDNDYDAHPVLATSEKINDAAIVVYGTYPVIALVEGQTNGFVHYFDGNSWHRDNQFTEVNTEEIKDIEIVAANDGVHILYLANDILRDVVWTAPGAELDRSDDPAIEGVKELTATYRDDGVYVFYTATADGELFLLEYGEGSWGEPFSLSSRIVGAAPEAITCSVNEGNDLTVAWENSGLIQYIQRMDGVWGAMATQPASTNPCHPQLPARIYYDAQPLIAWTEGTASPYDIKISQLGESPPEDTALSIALFIEPRSLPRGDTLKVTVIPNEPAGWLDVGIEPGDAWLDTLTRWKNEEDTSRIDSLTAFAYPFSTEYWSLATFTVKANAESWDGSDYVEVEDTFTVVPALDTSILIDPEKVFFVPNPAVQQQYGYVYYDLSYDARVTLEIFTARGKRILYYEEADGEIVGAGYHNFIEIDISGLGSDVYIFRFSVNASTEVEGKTTDTDLDDLLKELPKNEWPDLLWFVVTKPFVVVK